jgi:hypothetical protein
LVANEDTPMWKTVAVFTLAALLADSTAALAQKAPAKPRSAVSLECSRQADEKGLHGKARKKFRSKCLKDLKKKAA